MNKRDDQMDEPVIVINECIEELDIALGIFDRQIGRPEFNAEPGLERFRYRIPTPRVFQVLKCVRIISGLRACLALLKSGFTQEIGVLIRTIYEFLHDIDFIEQGIRLGELTSAQNEMLDRFFQHDLKRGEEMMNDHSKQPTILRKKVYSLIAKFLKPENPDRAQRLLKTLEDAYSGYVHGRYPHIMELYSGGDWRFYTHGMLGTSRAPIFLRAIAGVTHEALNQFTELAQTSSLNELATRLIDIRNRLESSSAYRKPEK